MNSDSFRVFNLLMLANEVTYIYRYNFQLV